MALKKKKLAPNKVTKLKSANTSISEIEGFAREYYDLSAKIKELSARKTHLASLLKDYAGDLGVEDDKGSKYLDMPEYVVGKVAKRSVSILQDEGVAFFKKKNLPECISTKVVETVNESEVEKMISEGTLEPEVINEFTDVNTTYQISLVKKEEMPEVEVATAAKKRGR